MVKLDVDILFSKILVNIITNYDRTSGLFPNGKCGIYFAHSRTAAGTDQIPY